MYRVAWHLVKFETRVLPTPLGEETFEAWGAGQAQECGLQFAYLEAPLDPHQVIRP
jgi:hypothetical protein